MYGRRLVVHLHVEDLDAVEPMPAACSMTFSTGYLSGSKCQYEYVLTAKRIVDSAAGESAADARGFAKRQGTKGSEFQGIASGE